jgi:hypothetical protein
MEDGDLVSFSWRAGPFKNQLLKLGLLLLVYQWSIVY